jgi:hypothetical protein
MPRKEKSPQEVIIKFCMTAKEEEIVALITTMHTIVGVRFTGDRVATAKVRKPRTPKATGPMGVVRPAGIADALKQGDAPGSAEPPAPTAVLGKAQEEAAARSPRRRARPPVNITEPVGRANGATPGPGDSPTQAAADTLPPQDTPDE